MTRKTKLFAKTASAILLACAACPAQAMGFASPSGNIRCYLDVYGDAPFDQKPLVCLVFEADWAVPPYESDGNETCDVDVTRTVTLSRTGPATTSWTCHGDVFWPEPLGTISYGSQWSLLGFTCDMATSGVSCANAAGNAVSINRTRLQN